MNLRVLLFAVACLPLFVGCDGVGRLLNERSELEARYEILDLQYLMLSDELHTKHFNWSPMAAARELESAQQAAQRVTIDNFNAIEIMRRADSLLLQLVQTKAAISAELEAQQTTRAIAFKDDLHADELFQEYLDVKQRLDELSGDWWPFVRD